MKTLLTAALIFVCLPVNAQIVTTDQLAMRTFATPDAAMSESANELFPLGMIPFTASFGLGTFRLTSYTTVQQLSNFESAPCPTTQGGGDDPQLWDFSVGCHIGQNSWSVTSRSSFAEVLAFYNSLTDRERKTFAWWKAPGVQSSEQYRYVINWQPQFTYCITGPI